MAWAACCCCRWPLSPMMMGTLGQQQRSALARRTAPRRAARMAPGPAPAYMHRQLLALVLLATTIIMAAAGDAAGGAGPGTVNEAVKVRHAARQAWREAQPEGCRAVGEGAGQKGRWCELHSDGSLTLRNARRLQRNLDELAYVSWAVSGRALPPLRGPAATVPARWLWMGGTGACWR